MRIACLLDNDFEDSEFRKPYDAFKAAGHEVVIIGLRPDARLTGTHGKEVVRAERGIADVKPDEFDALFLPGGYSRIILAPTSEWSRSPRRSSTASGRSLLYATDRSCC